MRKSCLICVVLCGLLFPLDCMGTTIVFLVAKDAIIGGAGARNQGVPGQRSRRTLAKCERSGHRIEMDGRERVAGTYTKIVLLKGRLIVASSENLHITWPHETDVIYDFDSWIRAIESRLRRNTSVSQLADIIKKEGSVALNALPIKHWIENGAIYQFNSAENAVEYLVAGYENRRAKLIRIDYQIDRERQLVICSKFETVLPNDSAAVDYSPYQYGMTSATREIKNPKSDAYQRMQGLDRLALRKIVSNKPMDSIEAAKAVRILIETEAEINPSVVGAGATIVRLPVDGDGVVSESNK
jgi:hypothetical protein